MKDETPRDPHTDAAHREAGVPGFKPASAALGIAGGLIAGAVFKRVWKLVAGSDDAPDASDLNRGWAEVLLAAAVQGAIVGTVRAALNRGYLLHLQQPDRSNRPNHSGRPRAQSV